MLVPGECVRFGRDLWDFLVVTQYVQVVEIEMTLRCMMLFEGFDQPGGWSEVYNLNQATVDQGVTAMDAIAAVRGQIMTADNTIIGYRITLPLAPPGPGKIRAQRTAYLATRNIPGSVPLLTQSSDVLWTGAMVRLNDATKTIFRNQIYRGIPDSFWSAGTDKQAQATLTPFWVNKWIAVLQQTAAGIIHTLRGQAGTQFAPITNGEYVRITRRATGRVFGGLRGRR
jgi:hypothetical protein